MVVFSYMLLEYFASESSMLSLGVPETRYPIRILKESLTF